MDGQMFLVLDPIGRDGQTCGRAEGALVLPEVARVLDSRGVATIQVVPELLPRNGIAGFFRRAFGEGHVLTDIPQRCCPMTMFCQAPYRTVHWRARLQLRGTVPLDGLVRLVPGADQEQVASPGLSAADPGFIPKQDLGPPGGAGGGAGGGE